MVNSDPRSQWSRYWEAMAGLMQGDFAHGMRRPPKQVQYGTFAHGMRALPPPRGEAYWDRGPVTSRLRRHEERP